MTASDLCAMTKPWPVQKWLSFSHTHLHACMQIAELVATELYAQGDREKCEYNIQPNDSMDCENSTHLPPYQLTMTISTGFALRSSRSWPAFVSPVSF